MVRFGRGAQPHCADRQGSNQRRAAQPAWGRQRDLESDGPLGGSGGAAHWAKRCRAVCQSKPRRDLARSARRHCPSGVTLSATRARPVLSESRPGCTAALPKSNRITGPPESRPPPGPRRCRGSGPAPRPPGRQQRRDLQLTSTRPLGLSGRTVPGPKVVKRPLGRYGLALVYPGSRGVPMVPSLEHAVIDSNLPKPPPRMAQQPSGPARAPSWRLPGLIGRPSQTL